MRGLAAGAVALGVLFASVPVRPSQPARASDPAPMGGRARPTDAEIGDIRVYLTPEQAVREIFTGVASVETLLAVLTADEMRELKTRVGFPAPSDTVRILRPRSAEGTTLGYAVMAEEVGKYRPITFLVGTDAERRVKGVEVLVYRESRGGEVRRERFLRQYRTKSAADPLRANRDILNVAGATLSVNAMNRGVKRVLITLDFLAARGVR